MKKQEFKEESFTKKLEDINDKNTIYLYKKYKQEIVFQLSSLDVENIISLERQGINLSPQDYIDLGGG